MAKSKNDYPKTFRPSLIFRIMCLVMTMYMVLFLTVFFSDIAFPTGVGILIAIVIFYFLSSILWYLLEFSFRQAIEITPDGIWFHSYGKCFYPWDSMIRFGRKGRYWGIVVEEPDITYSNVMAKWLFKIGHYRNFIPIDGIIRVQFLRVDLREDTDKFRQQTEFGRELAYFAPHLFDDMDKEIPKNRLNDDYDNNDYDIVETDRYQQEDNRK